MLYLETPEGFAPWAGEPIGGVVHPRNIEQLWSGAELAAVGLYTPVQPAVPEGKRVASRTVQRIGGVVKFVNTLEDIPAPTLDELYPPLEPWRFWAIVDMPGSIGEANLRGAIDAHPDAAFKAVARAKLNNPPGGRYHRSDALFSNEALLGALGIDEATVNTLWTQAHGLPG